MAITVHNTLKQYHHSSVERFQNCEAFESRVDHQNPLWSCTLPSNLALHKKLNAPNNIQKLQEPRRSYDRGEPMPEDPDVQKASKSPALCHHPQEPEFREYPGWVPKISRQPHSYWESSSYDLAPRKFQEGALVSKRPPDDFLSYPSLPRDILKHGRKQMIHFSKKATSARDTNTSRWMHNTTAVTNIYYFC